MTELSKQITQEEIIDIHPTSGWSALKLRELWRYRELMFFLTWRDIKVRYKQTLLGAAWAIIRPLVTMIVFTLIFGRVAKLDSEGMPYQLFSFTALLPWQLFSKALSDTSNSMVANRNMITKIYFPRLVIPFSSIISGLVDFGIAFVILIGMMFYYGVKPTSAIWTLPLFLVLALLTALGVGLWFSALNVQFRDVGYLIPFLTQVWLYATPVAYSAQIVSPKWQAVYALNPMAGVVQGFRWALLGTDLGANASLTLSLSVLISILILISGLFYFRRMERTFADVV
ncbi:MAG: phosphate ABC transporter permease [Anaerolineaceae bacterium 4572_5.1]|nr:MAG: phosphate ABC transporter permease [Anaerolineaceae bacterium 4572_5.1]RLD06281.1 MAG: ABC transporter permease [Chloroflexota bacterium]